MTSQPQERIDIACPDCPAVLPTRQGWQIHRRRKHGWVPTEKVCTRCGETKPVGAFGPISAGNTRPRSECRGCRGRPSTMTASEELRDRRKNIRVRFGMDLEHYELLIEYLIRKQRGQCAICQHSKPLVLDHCHATGRLRALLCRTCNTGLGMFRDNPDFLRTAADYLGG